ncbi:paraquat-inducible protein A [Cupriavidus sp. YR651]|uniref:paraquat-inducible protein A n=1 Tax=Cupriavidus sp. YR651 TaxID=1855315 RepID=UPI00088049F0|nr:paraquat-inducible protein A [Cupriavidus sp. YR651]SDC49611.1 paraquat-inducible protein A [Cupriavidus sp. YR651]
MTPPPDRPSPSRTATAREQLERSRRMAAGMVAELTDDDEQTPLPQVPTAASRGLLSCHACDLVSPVTLEGEPCPRCGATLHRRKPGSLARTWAFLLAAYILYIPANLLPVMVTQSILGTQRDTILSGVIYLWLSGSHLLAGVVLVASIVVPMLKMMILTLLLASVHLRSTWRIRQQTRLYWLVEVIGRWSMLDIFVVALLASLVRAGALATIIPGAGALAFASVVVLTMLASLSFDPRLLWDSLDSQDSDNARD